jgi:hypothetical protein
MPGTLALAFLWAGFDFGPHLGGSRAVTGDGGGGDVLAVPRHRAVALPVDADDPARTVALQVDPLPIGVVALALDAGVEPAGLGVVELDDAAFAGGYVSERSTLDKPNVESGASVGVSGGGLY